MDLQALRRQLELFAAQSVPFSNIVYRSSSPKYATEADLVTGEGSRRFGGRWNPIGLAVVYTSMTPESALEEVLAQNRYYGIPLQEALPTVIVAIQVSLSRVIDLSVEANVNSLGFSSKQLLAVDWREEMRLQRVPITQRVGEFAARANLEGIVVPSSVSHSGRNLLVFPQNLADPAQLSVFNADRLAR